MAGASAGTGAKITEPKINNFGSATLLVFVSPAYTAYTRTAISYMAAPPLSAYFNPVTPYIAATAWGVEPFSKITTRFKEPGSKQPDPNCSGRIHSQRLVCPYNVNMIY